MSWIETCIGNKLSSLLCSMAAAVIKRLEKMEEDERDNEKEETYVISCIPADVELILGERLRRGERYVDKIYAGNKICLIMRGYNNRPRPLKVKEVL